MVGGNKLNRAKLSFYHLMLFLEPTEELVGIPPTGLGHHAYLDALRPSHNFCNLNDVNGFVPRLDAAPPFPFLFLLGGESGPDVV